MNVKCGNRKAHGDKVTYHVSVAEVKACFASQSADHEDRQRVAVGAQPAFEPRQATDNERRALDTLAASSGCTDDERAYWKGLWAAEEVAQERAAYANEPVFVAPPTQHDEYGVLRPEPRPKKLSPKGREMPVSFGGSPKQYDLLFQLNEERNLGLDLADGAYFSVAAASQMITKIFEGKIASQPNTKNDYNAVYSDGMMYDPPKAAYATEDGIYRNPETGEIFKLQFNRVSGDGRHLYAKQLVMEYFAGITDEDGEFVTTTDIPLHEGRVIGTLEWRYVGAVAKAGVLPEWRVTRDEAAAFGKLYGVCVRCHRDLTKEESIERAMGPICANKMGW